MAIDKNDQDPFFYFNRGNVYLNLGQYDEAHEDYDRAIGLSPNNPKFYHSKGLAYEGKATYIMEKEKREDDEL
jgi:tetratricopeptide (TPR) repeat protein